MMLLDLGESIATLFTFLTFLLIILAPMVMTFIKTKIGKPDSEREAVEDSGSEDMSLPLKESRSGHKTASRSAKKTTGSDPHAGSDPSAKSRRAEGRRKEHQKKRPKDLFIELLRRADREDEAEIRFSTPRDGERKKRTSPPTSGREGRSPAASKKSQAHREFSQALETEFRDFDKDLGKPFVSVEEGRSASDAAEKDREKKGARKGPRLPNTPAVQRLVSLPELKRAVVMAELLGPPKGLGEEP